MDPAGASRAVLAGRVVAGVARAFVVVAMVAYPVLVWSGLARGSPRRIALVLLCVLLPAVAFQLRSGARSGMRALAVLPLVTVGALILAAALDASGYVLGVPVAINAVLLLGFGTTLRPGATPMVERFARLQGADLSPRKQAWCRSWTWIWCAFFVLNGGAALVLALAAPLSWWGLYNGLIAYALMGVLIAAEWTLRRRRFGSNAPNRTLGWGDPAVSRSEGRTTQTFRTRIPEDYAFFAGHFPTYPVLAGAVQLHELVLPCLRRARPGARVLRQLSGIKFPKRIRPGDDIEVRLGFLSSSGEVEFEITRGGERCTQGRLSMAPEVGGIGS